MREIKQLHAASKKTPLFVFHLFPHRLPAAPGSAPGRPTTKPPALDHLLHSRIRWASSNFQWQPHPYGGNVSPVSARNLAPPASRRSEWFTILQSKFARTLRLTGLHGSCS